MMYALKLHIINLERYEVRLKYLLTVRMHTLLSRLSDVQGPHFQLVIYLVSHVKYIHFIHEPRYFNRSNGGVVTYKTVRSIDSVSEMHHH